MSESAECDDDWQNQFHEKKKLLNTEFFIIYPKNNNNNNHLVRIINPIELGVRAKIKKKIEIFSTCPSTKTKTKKREEKI